MRQSSLYFEQAPEINADVIGMTQRVWATYAGANPVITASAQEIEKSLSAAFPEYKVKMGGECYAELSTDFWRFRVVGRVTKGSSVLAEEKSEEFRVRLSSLEF